MSRRVVIAIDGPAGAGKSTIARAIATRLGYVYIDSGAMYRAVALWATRTNIPLDDMHKLEQLALASDIQFTPGQDGVLLNGEDIASAIREPGVAEAASKISAIPGVRRALVDQQRKMGENASVVMEGRDIGSVVFPDAEVKIFLDARPQTRVDRRTAELAEADPLRIASEIEVRDQRDRNRADSPLVQAPDAHYIDSTGLTIDEVEALLLKLVRARTSNGKELAR